MCAQRTAAGVDVKLPLWMTAAPVAIGRILTIRPTSSKLSRSKGLIEMDGWLNST